MVHRDLKPANVLYDEINREVLIADFGLARDSDQSDAATDDVVFGTPAYMSPEQFAPAQHGLVGEHSDVYSLGVILYEMLTGRVPFAGKAFEVMIDHCQTPPRPPSVVRPGLDLRLDALCLKALAKRTHDRYPSAKAFADALTGYLRADAARIAPRSRLNFPIRPRRAPTCPRHGLQPLPRARVSRPRHARPADGLRVGLSARLRPRRGRPTTRASRWTGRPARTVRPVRPNCPGRSPTA